MAPRKDAPRRSVAENRKARYEYEISDTFEAGIVLTGSEVKSLRQGKANIAESYATEEGGEIYIINANIQTYKDANRFNHDERRPRKLLLHKKEISKLIGAIQREGMTLIPLRLFFNDKGRAKLDIGLAKGKKLHDKRQTEKNRDWDRQKARLLREKG
jgi:SsrA-binding protein